MRGFKLRRGIYWQEALSKRAWNKQVQYKGSVFQDCLTLMYSQHLQDNKQTKHSIIKYHTLCTCITNVENAFKWHHSSIHSVIYLFLWHVQNAIISCRSLELLAFLSVLYFSCHPSPPIILPSSLTSSWHLFLGLPLNLVVPKFIYNTPVEILFSSILCTSPKQRNLFNLTVSITVGFFNTCINFFIG